MNNNVGAIKEIDKLGRIALPRILGQRYAFNDRG